MVGGYGEFCSYFVFPVATLITTNTTFASSPLKSQMSSEQMHDLSNTHFSLSMTQKEKGKLAAIFSKSS